ncbi:MAG TPA: DUF3368 domain-containing protein [Verrucomicrobiae bacterium]|nr:DUF3368 domain-containing protein [Verrucomicrobiae bacterium]
MIVVSDTSPLSALISIGKTEILRSLFGEVLVPPAVDAELRRFHTELPGFVRVQPITNTDRVSRLVGLLDMGEAEAIVLAQETRADYLLMDEIAGRDVARENGLRVIGLLGVLIEAKKHRLIPSLRETLDQLEAKTTFYLAANLKARALMETGEAP